MISAGRAPRLLARTKEDATDFEIETPAPAREDGEMLRRSIPASRRGDLDKRMKRLSKRAAKLGLPAPTYEVIETFRKVVGRTLTDAPIYRTFLTIEIENPAVALEGGWTFLGVVQHTPAGNILRTARGTLADLAPYRESKSTTCDHCGTRRRRKDTYLVENAAHEVVRVGSTCIESYLGHRAFETLGYAKGLSAALDDAAGGGGAWVPSVATIDFLVVVAMVVRLAGWTSRGAARDGGPPATADLAWIWLFSSGRARQRLPLQVLEGTPSPADHAAAEKALAWAGEIDPATPSEYLSNLRVACALEQVSSESRTSGLVASALPAYLREVEREVQRRREAEAREDDRNEWVGRPGDKIGRKLSTADRRRGAEAHPAIEAEVVMTRDIDGAYGYTQLVKLRADDGLALTWFASGGAYYEDDRRVAPGDRVVIRGTVKKHAEYRGRRETVLTRCKLIPIPVAEAVVG